MDGQQGRVAEVSSVWEAEGSGHRPCGGHGLAISSCPSLHLVPIRQVASRDPILQLYDEKTETTVTTLPKFAAQFVGNDQDTFLEGSGPLRPPPLPVSGGLLGL